MLCPQDPDESGHPRADRADKAVAAIALFLQVVVLSFGYITWGQFGWRTYSKLAADMRIKDAKQQRKSFVLVNCFMTLLKLDIQVSTCKKIERTRKATNKGGTQTEARNKIKNSACQ